MSVISRIFQNNENSAEEKEAILEQDPEKLLKITKDDSRKERRHKLKQSFERNNVIMQVKKADILKEKDEADVADLYEGELLLPRTGELKQTVPNCCIICLDSYKKGDMVVWSSNEECQHAYHRACIVKYLLKVQKKVASTPCPCCRREFTDLEVEIRRKKRDRPRRVQRAPRARTSRACRCSWICPLNFSSFFGGSSSPSHRESDQDETSSQEV